MIYVLFIYQDIIMQRYRLQLCIVKEDPFPAHGEIEKMSKTTMFSAQSPICNYITYLDHLLTMLPKALVTSQTDRSTSRFKIMNARSAFSRDK